MTALLLFAGCTGDDDASEGDDGAADPSTEAFCDEVRTQAEAGEVLTEPQAQAEQLDALQEVAPEELQGDLDTIEESTEELQDVTEPLSQQFGDGFDADLVAAASNITAFMFEECELEAFLESLPDAEPDLEEFAPELSDVGSDFSDITDLSDVSDFDESFTDLSDFGDR